MQQEGEHDGLYIHMYGRFNVSTALGTSVLPTGAKTCALIALLATSEDLSRNRAWLQDMLWSDRGREQRAASLRQALSELRRTWAEWPDAVLADRKRISLNRETFRLIEPEFEGAFTFLEDLAVRDPAFTAWLGLQRLHRNKLAQETPTPVSAPVTQLVAAQPASAAIILCESPEDPAAAAMESAFQDVLSQGLREMADISLRSPRQNTTPTGSLAIYVKAMAPNSLAGQIRVSIEDNSDGSILWTGRAPLPGADSDHSHWTKLHALSSRTSEALANSIARKAAQNPSQDAAFSNLLATAVSNIFSIREDLVARAVKQLHDALSYRKHGLIYAWLAQAYTIQYVERYVTPGPELRERCEDACRNALALAPSNSNVLAAVANARSNINRDYEAGLKLAEQSIRANPANPLGWWAYSNALQCIGQSLAAFEAAQKAKALSEGTRFQFWSEFQVSLTSAVLGRQDAAIATGQLSSALAPDFRPPLRYLSALYALNGNGAEFSRTVEKLRQREPDFSVSRMIEDRDYPIGIMRRYGTRLTEALKTVSEDD